MATVREIKAKFTASAEGFKSTIDSIDKSMGKVVRESKKMSDNVGKNMKGAFGKLDEGIKTASINIANRLETISKSSLKIGDSFVNVGGQIQSVGGKLSKWITAPAVVATGAIGGLVASFGWGRLVGLDTAQAKLRGLGYETEDVGRISDQVTSAIEGGMTTMAEGVDIAAGALAAGVDEGEELERYIKLVGDAAVGANRPVNEMAQIFNRVQGGGRLMTQELNMIEDGMPGFAQAMADHVADGSLEAFREMVTNGEVGSEEFLTVMDDFAGGMAEAYAESWGGMVANTKAYIGIIGENLLGGVFEQSKESLAEFIEFLSSEEVIQWAEDVGLILGDIFSRIVTWVQSAIEWFMNLQSGAQKMIGMFGLISVAIGPFLLGLGTVISVVGNVIRSFGLVTGALEKVFRWIGVKGLAGGLKTLASRFSFLLGPVGIAIGVITTLAGIFIVAYRNSETFRNIIDGLVDTFRSAIDWIKDFGKAISGIWSGDAFDQDGAMELLYKLGLSEDQVSAVFNAVETIKDVYEGLKDGVQVALGAVGDFFRDTFQGIKDWWDRDGEMIMDAVRTSFEYAMFVIKNVVDMGIAFVIDVFERFAPIVSGIFNTLWPVIVNLTQTAWEGIKLIIGVAMDLIKGIISGVSALIEGDWSRFGEVIAETAKSIWERVVEFFTNLMNNAMDLINDLTGGGIDKFIEMRDGVVGWVTDLVNSVIEWWNDLTTRTSESFSGMVEGVLGFFENLWIGARDKVIVIRDGIVDRFTEMKNRVIEKVEEIFGPTIETFQNIYTAVSDKVTEIRITLTEIWNRIRAIIGGVVQAIYENLRDRFMEIYTNVRDRVVALRNRLTEIWNNIKNRIVEIALNIYNGLRDRFMSIYNEVSSRISSLRTSLVNIWNNIRDRVVNIALNLYNRLKDRFLSIYNNVRDRVDNLRNRVREIFGNMRDRVVEIVRNLYNRVSDWFGDIYNTVRDKMRDAKNKAVDFATDLYTGAKEQFENLVDGAKDMMTGIGNAIDNLKTNVVNKAKDLGVGIANAAIDGFNGLIKGINWVADKLGAPKIDLIDRISRNSGGGSTGSAGVGTRAIRASTGLRNHKGGPVLVGDRGPGNSYSGGGSSTREIVEFPNKKRYLMDGNVLIPNAPKGMNVLSNRETEKEIDLLKAFNPEVMQGGEPVEGGSGGFNSWLTNQVGKATARTIGTKEKAKGVYKDTTKALARGLTKATVTGVGLYEDIMDYVENPGKLFSDILGNYVNMDLVEYPLEMAMSGINHLKDSAIKTFKSWFEDFGSGGDGSHILGKKIYQYFGRYTGGISFNGGKHYGIDTAHKHEPLLSPVNGKVTRSWWDRGGGNSLEVTTDKYIWWFMHLSKILKKVGDSVKAGQKIAITGNTGSFLVGTGHLHTQVSPRSKGAGNHTAIDPLPILRSLSPRGSSKAVGKAGTTGTMANVAGYAQGTITDGKPELAMLNEEQMREAIISFNPKHRARSEKIWETTGNHLGFGRRDQEVKYLQEIADNTRRSNDLDVEGLKVLRGILEKDNSISNSELYDRFMEVKRSKSKTKRVSRGMA